MTGRLAYGLGIFVGSLLIGWWCGWRGVLTEAQAKRLIHVSIRWLSPVVLCLSFWGLSLRGASPLLLPLIGALLSLAALLPAWGYCRWAGLSRPQTGSFLTCAMFSNVGFLGAFVAFALAGEAAYSLCMLYVISFSPCFYLVGFTLAKRFGHPRPERSTEAMFSDELRVFPFLGLGLGLALRLLGVPRPAMCEPINSVLIPISTVMYLVAVVSQLHFGTLGRWFNASLAMSLVKFGYSPLVGWALVTLFHVEGVARFVVLLLASMPVAISPLMLPMVFGLDTSLTSALWLYTTLLTIPWLFIYIPLIR